MARLFFSRIILQEVKLFFDAFLTLTLLIYGVEYVKANNRHVYQIVLIITDNDCCHNNKSPSCEL